MAENQVRPAGAQLAKQPSVFTLKQSFPVWFKQFRNYAELLQVQVNQRYRTLLSFLDAESFTIVENLAFRARFQGGRIFLFLSAGARRSLKSRSRLSQRTQG